MEQMYKKNHTKESFSSGKPAQPKQFNLTRQPSSTSDRQLAEQLLLFAFLYTEMRFVGESPEEN